MISVESGTVRDIFGKCKITTMALSFTAKFKNTLKVFHTSEKKNRVGKRTKQKISSGIPHLLSVFIREELN
jgi:hypothetical protein